MYVVSRLVSLFVVIALLIGVQGEGRRFNIIHTTDIHGWIAGHTHEPTLNADLGDFQSLITHLGNNAYEKEEEFLLFDSGDIIEGTGLSDASPVHGQYIFPVMQRLTKYNALTMGNHDIGAPAVVDMMEGKFIPSWNNSYLTANSKLLPSQNYIGRPFTVFETSLGSKILVLGYLYNFTHNANNTEVVPVSVSVTESYFEEAMKVEDVDLIVVIAHIAPQSPPELMQIYKAIRSSSYHETTPLAMFVGHSHVTYFKRPDENAFILESGKYFEVIGRATFEIENGKMYELDTDWVATSLSNFYEISGTDESTFDTPDGLETSKMIQEFWEILGLNITYGCAPQNFSLLEPYNEPQSLFNLYVNKVIPLTVFSTTSENTPFFISNSASLRYDLYAGPVTRNDIYTISPFNDTFMYYSGIPGSDLKTLLTAITNVSQLTMTRCKPYHAFNSGVVMPDWFYSTTEIVPTTTYDLVLASYDAQTVQPTIVKLFGNVSFSKFSSYPTKQNGTGAIQTYVQQEWPCPSDN